MNREIPSSIRTSQKDSGRKVAPEFPIGEIAIQRTIDSVNVALRENLPSEFHPQLNLTQNQINFGKTPEEILVMDRKERLSKPQYIYDGLIESGMSTDEVSTLFANKETARLIPTYWHQPDNGSPIIYIPRNVKHNLSKDQQMRMETALYLGFQLVEDILKNLAIPSQLSGIPWQQIAQTNMEQFFEEITEPPKDQNSNYPNLNIKKFNSLRQEISDLLNNEATKFVAHGAEVHVVFPGQDLSTSDFSLGYLLNQGIITLISKGIQGRFTRHLLRTSGGRAYQTRPESEKKATNIIKILGINDLTTSFLYSIIPLRYLDYRKDKAVEALIDRIFKASFDLDSSTSQQESELSAYPE